MTSEILTGRKVAFSCIEGTCSLCGEVFVVESNIGIMQCPHCGTNRENITWRWGKFVPIFVEDKNGVITWKNYNCNKE